MSDPDELSDFVCATCLRDVPSMDRCPHCGSVRTILKSVLPEGVLEQARKRDEVSP